MSTKGWGHWKSIWHNSSKLIFGHFGLKLEDFTNKIVEKSICNHRFPENRGKSRWDCLAHWACPLWKGQCYTNTTPILPVQRPITFHLVCLECICNLGWSDSIHTPRCWGCQIRCIGVDRRREAILNQKSHISQKASPPWCITWRYWPWNKQ